MKTIARNRTAFIAHLKITLTQCRRYDSATGEMVPADPQSAWQALGDSAHARLIENTDRDKYTVQIHSNLWYDLRSA